MGQCFNFQLIQKHRTYLTLVYYILTIVKCDTSNICATTNLKLPSNMNMNKLYYAHGHSH